MAQTYIEGPRKISAEATIRTGNAMVGSDLQRRGARRPASNDHPVETNGHVAAVPSVDQQSHNSYHVETYGYFGVQAPDVPRTDKGWRKFR